MMSQSDIENDLLHAAAAAAERDAGILTAAAARKRARADAGGDSGSTGERVCSPERAAARSSRKRRAVPAVLDARTATTAEARCDAITATEAAVTARTEQRAAAKAARHDADGRAVSRASAAPAFVRVVVRQWWLMT